jgi:phosphatidylserine/phosphatidylglycerophosphate/cardiolipin synthase-like enzyme
MANAAFDSPILLTGNDPKCDNSIQAKAVRDVAGKLAQFIAGAKRSIHIAIYDFRLDDEQARDTVVQALNAASQGKDLKIAYDHTRSGNSKSKGGDGNDLANRGTQVFVQTYLPKVQSKAIAGSHLMHDKYVIRDMGTPDAAVWMGSANFTDGAWSLQENNILQIHSTDLADHYEQDFQDLWKNANIVRTGINDYGELKIGADSVEYAFSPGEGSTAASLFVDAIQGAEGETIWLSTMVLSSGPILGALIDHLAKKGKIVGVYDATQMAGVEKDWAKTNSTKLEQWEKIKPLLKGKHSASFSTKSAHDFMHNKVLVTDHVVVTGSFNLSQNAESNAENVLSIHDEDIAGMYKTYITGLIKLYGKANVTSPGSRSKKASKRHS